MATIDPRTTAVEGVVRILKRRAQGIDLWRVWDGSPTSDDPLPVGRTSVRVVPVFEPEEVVSSCGGKITVSAPVLLRIETRTPDTSPTRPNRHLGLFAEVMDALLDPAERQALSDAGVSWVEPAQPPDPASSDALDAPIVGGVRIAVFITRP
jgi:hypothetical protein